MTAEFPGCKSWCTDHSERLQTCTRRLDLDEPAVRVSIVQTWTSGSWGEPAVYVGVLGASLPGLKGPRQLQALILLMRQTGSDRLADHLSEVADRFKQVLAGEPLAVQV